MKDNVISQHLLLLALTLPPSVLVFCCQDMAKAESEGHLKAVADQLALSVEYCERERQWPSKRSEAYPPGSFSLSPQALKAVRKAYYKPPPLE
jgi:hypothetical protein